MIAAFIHDLQVHLCKYTELLHMELAHGINIILTLSWVMLITFGFYKYVFNSLCIIISIYMKCFNTHTHTHTLPPDSWPDLINLK